MTFGRKLFVVCLVGCGGGSSSSAPDAGPMVDAGPMLDAGPMVDTGVTIDAPNPTPLTIKLFNHFPQVEGDTANADFVAAQDGDGAWTPLTGDSGVYTMPRAADHYGVLVVCRAGTAWSSKVFLKSVAQDGLLHTTSSCLVEAAEPTVPVTVQLRGTPAGQSSTVTAPATAAGLGADGDVTLQLFARPNELLGWVSDPNGDHTAKLVRIAPFTAATGQAYTIDFATGVDPAAFALTATGDTLSAVSAGVATATGQYLFPTPLGNATYQTLPAALRRAGDRNVIEVFGDHGSARIEQVTPGPVTVDLLPALTEATVVATAGPAAPQPTWTVPTLPARRSAARVIMSATTTSADGSRRWQVFLSRDRSPAGTSSIYQLPDFATLATGFPTASALFSASQIAWTVTVDDITTQADTSFVDVSTSFSGTLPTP